MSNKQQVAPDPSTLFPPLSQRGRGQGAPEIVEIIGGDVDEKSKTHQDKVGLSLSKESSALDQSTQQLLQKQSDVEVIQQPKQDFVEMVINRRVMADEDVEAFRPDDGKDDNYKKFKQESLDDLAQLINIQQFELQYPKSNNIEVSDTKNAKENILTKDKLEKRYEEMRNPKNDVDTFIIDKFTEQGVENIYGKAKYEPKKKHELDLLDTTIQTHLIKGHYFFVIYGFKKSEKKLQNGQYGQANLCLYIYKVDQKTQMPDFDKPVFKDENINNISYHYCLYKNFQPILKFNNAIYYMKVFNDTKDNQARLTLVKFDMGQVKEEIITNSKGEVTEKITNPGAQVVKSYEYLHPPTDLENRRLIVTSVAFTTTREHNHSNETDFLQNNSAIAYLQAEDEVDKAKDEEKEEYYTMLYQINLNSQESNWAPYPQIDPYPWDQYKYNKYEQQRIHMWVADPPKFKDIHGSELEIGQVNYKKCPPYYQYTIENNTTHREKLGVGDKSNSFDKLLQVFEIHENHHHEAVKDSSPENKLKSINIIDDQQLQILTVIFAHKTVIKYKRYENQRFRTMNPYAKGDLDHFSRFVQSEQCGLVIPGYTNLFAKNIKQAAPVSSPVKLNRRDSQKDVSDKLPSYIKRKATKVGHNNEGEDKILDYEICFINRQNQISKIEDKGGAIDQKKIMENEMMHKHKLNYYVYDLITNKRGKIEKKHNVYRLENIQTNPYVRFKMVGGPHEGLSIRFSTVKANYKIYDHKIMTEFSPQQYKQAGLAWSSELYTLDNSQNTDHNQIYQNIQWAQVSDDGTYCKIIEFEVSWPQNLETMEGTQLQDITDHLNCTDEGDHEDVFLNQEESKEKFHVNPIGMKIVLFQDKLETANNTNPFYSMYDEKNKIIGTQWIPCTDRISKSYEKHKVFYQLKNSTALEFRYESDFVKSNFYYYHNKDDGGRSRGYTVIQSMISDLLDDHIFDFEPQEVIQILNNEIRCIVNMYPTQMKDIIGINIKLDDYDFLQSSEVLDRQCIADYFLFQPNTIAKMVSKFDPEKVFIHRSIIQMFIDHHGCLQHHIIEFQRHGLYRAPGCISIDRIHSNTLARCFDEDKTYQILYDVQQAKTDDKTTFQHIKDVLIHYNNKYNPIKVLKPSKNDEEIVKEYFCPNSHKCEQHQLDENDKKNINGTEMKPQCEKSDCNELFIPDDENEDNEIYKCQACLKLFHKRCLQWKFQKSDQERMKDESILKMSGQHLLNYVLKKKPNIVEHDFISNIMEILIEENVQFQSFFENSMQYGTYTDNEFQKSYANLVDMKELPDSTKDRSVIRLLRNKHDGIRPFDSRGDHDFIKRFMENYYEYAKADFITKKKELEMSKKMHEDVLNYVNDADLDEQYQDEFEEELDRLSPVKSIMSPKSKDGAIDKSLQTIVSMNKRSKKYLRSKFGNQPELKKERLKRFEQIGILFLKDQDLTFGKQNKKEQKTQNFVIDFSSKKLYNKMIQLQRSLKIEPQENFDLYALSCLMTSINEAYGNEIEQHTVLQKIIDSLFADTARYFKKLIVLYMFYVIPFFMQMLWYQNVSDNYEIKGKVVSFWTDDEYMIIICNCICMFVTTIFFGLEIVQIMELKSDYFIKEGAHHEILWFFLQLTYFLFKLNSTKVPFPLYDHIQVFKAGTNEDSSSSMIIIQSWLTILILMMFTKQTLYFIQYNHKFGTMVNLVYRTLGQVSEFLIFFFLTIMLASTILKTTGFDIVVFQDGLNGGCSADRYAQTPTEQDRKDTFKDRNFVTENNSIIQYYIYTFWNAIGQATTPCYPYWMKIINQQEVLEKNPFEMMLTEKVHSNLDIQIARGMRLVIWIMWIFLVTFLFIVLCNFLIAYISQSYEDVLEKRIPDIYKQRCVLNEEYYLFRKWFWKKFRSNKIKSFDCFLLTFDTNDNLGDDDADAHLGVIKKVQETLKDHKSEIREAINLNGVQMNRVQEEMKLYRHLMTNYKKQLSDTGTDIISNCNSIILQNNKRIPEVLEKELEKQKMERDGKGKVLKGTAAAMNSQQNEELKFAQRNPGEKYLR